MNISNFSVPPPFAANYSGCFCDPIEPCVPWGISEQVAVSCVGGVLAGMMITSIIAKIVKDPLAFQKISRGFMKPIPEESVAPSAPPMTREVGV